MFPGVLQRSPVPLFQSILFVLYIIVFFNMLFLLKSLYFPKLVGLGEVSGNPPRPDTVDPGALPGLGSEVESVWSSFRCLVIETDKILASHHVLDRVAG